MTRSAAESAAQRHACLKRSLVLPIAPNTHGLLSLDSMPCRSRTTGRRRWSGCGPPPRRTCGATTWLPLSRCVQLGAWVGGLEPACTVDQ